MSLICSQYSSNCLGWFRRLHKVRVSPEFVHIVDGQDAKEGAVGRAGLRKDVMWGGGVFYAAGRNLLWLHVVGVGVGGGTSDAHPGYCADVVPPSHNLFYHSGTRGRIVSCGINPSIFMHFQVYTSPKFLGTLHFNGSLSYCYGIEIRLLKSTVSWIHASYWMNRPDRKGQTYEIFFRVRCSQKSSRMVCEKFVNKSSWTEVPQIFFISPFLLWTVTCSRNFSKVHERSSTSLRTFISTYA